MDLSHNNTLKFVNHASVLIKGTRNALLSDPWYSGSAFNNGWRLLYENDPDAIADILDETTHIWISHEHPDHFSIEFLKRYKDKIKGNGITFIFQQTKDGRIARHLRENGFVIAEVASGETIELEPGFLVQIIKNEFYDSACLVTLDGVRIFNLNDCPIRAVSNLQKFCQAHGPCDILLTQFSYAAWKGGKDNKAWRVQAAQEKLDIVRNQAKILQAKIVIPFASFVWFSNVQNFYLCDSVNLPGDVVKHYEHEPFKTLFMRPYETLDLKDWKDQDPASIDFWQQKYETLSLEHCYAYEKSYTVDELIKLFANYCQRIEKGNSWLLIKTLSHIPALGVFQPVTFRLQDLNLCLRADLPNKTLTLCHNEPDISLHSNMLAFLLNNPFGFDTLTVNGCFEETRIGGFTRLAKSLALENLNNIGIYLGPSLFFNIGVIRLFMIRLVTVANRLKAR